MVSEIALAGASLSSSPFNISLFESCPAAMDLLKTASHIAEFGQNIFFNYLASLTTNTTTVSQFRRSTLMHLSTLAIRNSNVSNILLSTFEKYEYPEGRGKFDFVATYFRTEESSLPPCQFDSIIPVNRERYVYCTHLVHFFALAQTIEIFRQCSWPEINSKYNLIALDSIGSYLLSAELTHPPDPLVEEPSWAIRASWDNNLRKAFCKSKNDRDYYWKQALCADNSSLPPKEERTFAYWKRVIKPLIDSNGDVLSTTVSNELFSQLDIQRKAYRNFQRKALDLQRTLNKQLKEVADTFTSSRKESKLLAKILNGAQQLKEFMNQLNRNPSLEIWNQLQEEIQLLDFNLGQTQLAGQFDDIKNTLQQAKAFPKPNEEIDDSEIDNDEL